jgi:hypothetical protein
MPSQGEWDLSIVIIRHRYWIMQQLNWVMRSTKRLTLEIIKMPMREGACISAMLPNGIEAGCSRSSMKEVSSRASSPSLGATAPLNGQAMLAVSLYEGQVLRQG